MADQHERTLATASPLATTPFTLADGVRFATAPDQMTALGDDWRPLTDLPVVIVVGVTGVGKSTTLRLLAEQRAFSLLPDRRRIADEVVIGTLQALDGHPPAHVADRVTRLDYTARYRRLFGGGLAHALAQLLVDRRRLAPPLLFDGLRGRDEVAYAVDQFGQSRFVVLYAPDTVRVERLLGRDDAFDATAVAPATAASTLDRLAALPGVEAVFTPDQLAGLAGLEAAGVTAQEIEQQVAIVVAERRNYDPDAALAYLQGHLGPARLLAIDTSAQPASAVAAQIAAWL